MTGGQNFDKRTFSSQASNFYSYYDYDNIYYCGAGSFPCGSVAGTPGYMCSKQIIKLLSSKKRYSDLLDLRKIFMNYISKNNPNN
jgi:phytoene dehydrogenase-like protein